MKKTLVVVILTLGLLVSSVANCVASTSTNNATKAPSKSTTVQPMISNWHYQYNTPLVGTSYDYDMYEGTVYNNLQLQSDLCDETISMLAAGIDILYPESDLSADAAGSIVTAVNHSLLYNEPSLYNEEDTWYYGSSLNYEVVQTWYADAAHTKYIATTVYYGSFY